MQFRKSYRLLAIVLTAIILGSYFPMESFAAEEYDSYNLEELKFYIGDEEVSMEENFFQDKYYPYTLNLPRETRELKVKAVPVTKGAKIKIYNGSGNWYDIDGPDYTTTITFKEEGGLENFNDGMKRGISIKVIPNNPPKVSWKPQYTVNANISGYPKPEIKGTKKQFIFEQHQKVTKEELLEGVKAIDELDGDITDKMEIIPYTPKWYKGNLDTRFLVEDGMIRYHVKNSHGRVGNADIPVKVIKEKPADLDITPPEFFGLESKTFHIGEIVDKAKLLEGVTAIDDVDGDITDKIEVMPDSINTNKPQECYVTYTVKDTAGNRTEKRVKHIIIEKPIEQEYKEKRVREIIESNAPNYYGTGKGWEAIDLAIYGKQNLIHKESLLAKSKEIIKNNPEKVTGYEKIAISLTAAGLDARNVTLENGTKIDLIKKIANFDNTETLNDYIWAILAYDSGNYPVSKENKWTRKDLIDYILRNQLSDGSWSIDNKLGSQLDVITTATAISALAPYKGDPEVEKALEKAVNALGRVKTKDYCFIYGPYNAETSESSSMVLIALASMGIDPNTDSRFSDSTKSVIDGQLSFVNEKNLFKHVKVFVDGHTPESSSVATERGFRALATYINAQEKGYTPYHAYQFADYGRDEKEPEPVPEAEIDKTKLEEAISRAEKVEVEDKTEESVQALNEAILKGKEILGKEKVTQEEIDSAVRAIEVSINNLEDKEDPKEPEPKPEIDKTKLKETINKAEKIDTEGKTKDSIRALEVSILKGKEIFENEKITQEEVDNAVKSIEDSINSLKDEENPTKPTSPIKPQTPNDSEYPPKPTKPQKPSESGTINKANNVSTKPNTQNKPTKTSLPKTGQSSMMCISILGVMLLLVGTKIWLDKKKGREV
ncbi:MAG: FIVAR domain-containing protein [Clostridiaceae bacterium]|nr:FIVAR domain-containing protein [Clostridiaceae bacterium]MBW4858489.1 FIVAR domain-containing protein [Clostridiaceae bacterium]MBW4869321.1 FIVAR domain-containing protein [Clostridiaceae bacterium]